MKLFLYGATITGLYTKTLFICGDYDSCYASFANVKVYVLMVGPLFVLGQVGVNISLCADSPHLHSYALCAATHIDV